MYLKFKVFTLELHISWYDWPAGIEKKMNTIHIFWLMNIQYTLLKNNLFVGITTEPVTVGADGIWYV